VTVKLIEGWGGVALDLWFGAGQETLKLYLMSGMHIACHTMQLQELKFRAIAVIECTHWGPSLVLNNPIQ
jgi:hypothetical protein